MTNLQLYRRMFRFLRPQLPAFLMSVVLSFTVVTLEGLTLWLSAPLVRTLFMPDGAPPERPAWSMANAYQFLKYHTYAYLSRHDPMTALKLVCILIVCAFLAKNLIAYVKGLLIARVNLNVERDLRNTLYRHALHLPVSYYDRNASSKIIALIVRDVSTINASMTGTLDKLLLEPMRIVVFLAMLFAISARLTLALLLVLPILAVCIGAIGSAVRRRSKRVLQTFSGLIAVLHETVGGIRTVKLFGMENVERDKFNGESQRLVDRSFRSTVVGRLTGPFTETLGVAVAVVLLWFGGREVLSGRGVTPEDFLLFLLYVFSCFKPLKTLSSVNSLLQTGFAAAERVFSVLDSPTEPMPTEKPSPTPALTQGILFENVCFRYPGTEEVVLDDICFEVAQGDIVALVGPSGSGKSTILDLLPRFYEPTDGRVLIDGADTRDIELHELRRYFGTVAQETLLF
ncbi:MAG: ATP-binding cassette domain-containing protein, partial [Chitinivibrionales bacterium]|nr:ATP-binding cassette domain-containing protein [Chitinivibrionales bacterium]